MTTYSNTFEGATDGATFTLSATNLSGQTTLTTSNWGSITRTFRAGSAFRGSMGARFVIPDSTAGACGWSGIGGTTVGARFGFALSGSLATTCMIFQITRNSGQALAVYLNSSYQVIFADGAGTWVKTSTSTLRQGTKYWVKTYVSFGSSTSTGTLKVAVVDDTGTVVGDCTYTSTTANVGVTGTNTIANVVFGKNSSAATGAITFDFDEVYADTSATDWPAIPGSSPTASFTKSASNLTVSVNGSASAATASGASITGYSWSWGDGTSNGTGSTASHTYSAAGTYTVTLTVTDSNGVTATTSQSVTVSAPAGPTASFTQSVSNLTASVDATASTAGTGTITSYSWAWGDSSSNGYSTPTATHTYSAAGTYTVTLTVTNSGGSTATATQTVSVATTAAPVATVQFNAEGGTAGATVTTSSTGSGTTPSLVVNDSGNTLAFDTAHVAHGSKAVRIVSAASTNSYLRLVAAQGSTSFAYRRYFYLNTVPSALVDLVAHASSSSAYAGSLSILASGKLAVRDASGAWTGMPQTSTALTAGQWYRVDVQGISATSTTGTIAMQLYTGSSLDTLTTAVYNSGTITGVNLGNSVPVQRFDLGKNSSTPGVLDEWLDDFYAAIGTNNPIGPYSTNPTPLFTATPSGLTVTVDATSSSAVPPATLSTYTWSWGDGSSTSAGATASHTYATGGQSYTITLTVTDSTGASSTTGTTVTLAAPTIYPEAYRYNATSHAWEPVSANVYVAGSGWVQITPTPTTT